MVFRVGDFVRVLEFDHVFGLVLAPHERQDDTYLVKLLQDKEERRKHGWTMEDLEEGQQDILSRFWWSHKDDLVLIDTNEGVE